MKIDAICDACKKFDRIFLYGAGTYGKICLKILKERRLSVAGFLQSVSDGGIVEGVPVHSFSDIAGNLSKSDCIVLSVSDRNKSEIMKHIPDELHSQVLPVNETELSALQEEEIEGFFRELSGHRKAGKYTGSRLWKKILVVRLDCLGDMVWTTPLFRELRGNFPEAEIAVVVRPQIEPLIRNCPYIDRISCYDVSDLKAGLSCMAREKAKEFASEHLVKEKFDVVFLPRPVFGYSIMENVLLAFYSEARLIIAPYHSEDNKKNQRIYERISPYFSILTQSTWKTHSVEYILDMLRHCNCKIRSSTMELWPTAEERRKAGKMLHRKEHTVYVAVGIVGNTQGQTWGSKNYRDLIGRYIRRHRARVHFVLCGAANAAGAAHTAMEGNEQVCTDLAGKTSLPEVVAVIEACNLYIGSNTGLMHIAAAVHTPVIQISCKKAIFQDSGVREAEGRSVYPRNYAGGDEEFPIEAIDVDDVDSVLADMIERCALR